MELRADKADLCEILRLFADDILDIAHDKIGGELIAGSIQMTAEIGVFAKFVIVYRRIFVEIEHISKLEFFGKLS